MALTALPIRASVPPLTPDGDEARRWAEAELSKAEYAEAQPTLIDRISRAVGDFVRDLFATGLPDGAGATFAIIATIVIGALVVTALLVWGLPRVPRRSRRVTGELFGEREDRGSVELRREAASLAAAGAWSDALVVRFRALARALAERGVLETAPGTTVHAFARAASAPFPAFATELESAAAAFDDVRYLRRPGTQELYERVANVDDALMSRHPAVAQPADRVAA